MGKLEPFDGKQTKWQGLWWHPEINAFTSSVLNLADLRKFKGMFRIQIRKNKFYNNGENGRPNYNFSIRDANSPIFFDMEVDDDEYANEDEEDNERVFTYEQIQDLINRVACAVGGDREYGEHLVSDFLDWG